MNNEKIQRKAFQEHHFLHDKRCNSINCYIPYHALNYKLQDHGSYYGAEYSHYYRKHQIIKERGEGFMNAHGFIIPSSISCMYGRATGCFLNKAKGHEIIK